MLKRFKKNLNRVNIFYIGLPKCASTWLYQSLKDANDVVLSNPRDLHYFDLYFNRGENWYHKFFKDIEKGSNKKINYMDICHDYIFYKSAIERIYKYNPKSILIVHFRNPLQLLFSLYSECCQNNFLYFIEHGYKRPTTFEDYLIHPFTLKILNYKNNIENIIKIFPSNQILISSNEYIKNNLKGYISMFTKITTIKCESFKDPQIIVRPVGSKSKYSRYLLTILSFISMTFRKSGIPILMRIINLKSFLNEPKLLNKKKSNPLKPDSNFNDQFEIKILDLFKKINGMDYKTFIEKYSSSLDS